MTFFRNCYPYKCLISIKSTPTHNDVLFILSTRCSIIIFCLSSLKIMIGCQCFLSFVSEKKRYIYFILYSYCYNYGYSPWCKQAFLLLLISINIAIYWILVLLLALFFYNALSYSKLWITVILQQLIFQSLRLLGWPWVRCSHWGSAVDGIAFVFCWFVPVCMMSVYNRPLNT